MKMIYSLHRRSMGYSLMGLKPELEARSNRVNGLKVSILFAPEVHGLFSAQSTSVRAQTAKPVVLSLSSSPCKRRNPTTVKQTDVNGWRVLGMFQLQLGNSPCREGAGLSLSVSFQQRGTSQMGLQTLVFAVLPLAPHFISTDGPIVLFTGSGKFTSGQYLRS